ncbi:MAG: hypothetical protein DRG78_06410 [Epsilonproteobacteria bacterium]|nr:MAG: hypothetical protein DRG78_06410 [Campylobacterota bacterium]
MNKFLLIVLFSFTFVFGIDKDNDLIPDDIDKCLETPDGVFVTSNGCTQQLKRIIHFKHASYTIEQSEQQILEEIIELSIEGFGYKILIQGHTDSVSDAKYNLELSKKRAITIKNIILNSKIDKNRIKIEWYGEIMPISSNITEKSRAKNRRVEITFK